MVKANQDPFAVFQPQTDCRSHPAFAKLVRSLSAALARRSARAAGPTGRRTRPRHRRRNGSRPFADRLQLDRKKRPAGSAGLSHRIKSWRRPTLPRSCPRSTIGAERLNCRVRNGNGCGPLARITRNKTNRIVESSRVCPSLRTLANEDYGQASRPISTGKLKTLLLLHFRPINLVVSEGPSAAEAEGYLIFGWASRLDAFSAYPFRTQLPSAAPGGTTGTLEVRGFRSSRTRKPSRQVSCAHRR